MKIRDLGRLEGDVLAFGGPYSNLQATSALIDTARQRGIAPENCICTGDVVAYCADAAKTVDAIRDFGCPVVAGNMEQQLGAGADNCGCGFEAGTTCDILSGTWFAHAAAQMTSVHRRWMADCPGWIVFEHMGQKVAVIHGGASDVALFLWSVSPQDIFADEWRAIEKEVGRIDVVISGHSGIGFIRHFDFGTWVNAGAIGMPAHDGDARLQFATLSGDGPQLHRLVYDQDAACAAMEAAGLTQGYHRALVTGYWPSEGVLPPELTLSARAKG